MTTTNQKKGMAFELWVQNVISPFAYGDAHLTEFADHHDIEFSIDGLQYILECKVVKFFTQHKVGKYPNAVCFQKSQLKHLLKMARNKTNDKEVFAIIGIMFNEYDIYPVVTRIENIQKFGANGDRKGRTFVQVTTLLKFTPLRTWVRDLFDIQEIDVHYPEFRQYLSIVEELM